MSTSGLTRLLDIMLALLLRFQYMTVPIRVAFGNFGHSYKSVFYTFGNFNNRAFRAALD